MRKKALSLLLALTLCLTALTPAAALDTGDAPEQPAAQGQTVSEGQETTAGGQDASVSEEPEAPASGEEEPASEEEEQPAFEEEQPASEEEEQPASEEQEKPASEEEQPQPAEEEPEQPAAAPAAEPALLAAANGIAVHSGDTHTPHNICGDEGCTEHGGKDVTWTAVSTGSQIVRAGENSTAESPAYCYLTADFTPTFSLEPTGYTVLCLNGHKINGDNESVPVITVKDGATFTLCDCGGAGQIVQAGQYNKGGVKVEGGTFNMYGGAITRDEVSTTYTVGVDVSGGTFNMYGGTIKGNISGDKGGGVYVNGGTFNMSGGSITENCASGGSALPGGGVYVKNGTFTMTGGSITNNYPAGNGGQGGGVYVGNDGTFTMRGGSISGNRAAINSSWSASGKGGGVYVGGGTFTMTGGRIYGNIANNSDASGNGGGVYVDGGKFTVSGDAYIAGNKVGATSDSATETNNVYLASNGTITVGDELNDGARIGVAGKKLNAVVAVPATGSSVTLTESDAAKFVSDRNGMYRGQLDKDTNSVKLASVTHSHCIYGETNCTDTENHGSSRGFGSELWMDPSGTLWIGNTMLDVTSGSYNKNYYALAASTSSDTATYYLGSDLDLKYPLYITKGTVRLCLNGHTLRSKKAADDPSGTLYSVITLLDNSSATLNLTDCGTTGKVTHASGENGSGVYMGEGTKFNLYNGSITGNTASSGAGVDVYGNNAAFAMFGGSITGNKATSNSTSGGGGVNVSGSNSTFTMSGGEITGNTAKNYGGGVYVLGQSNTFTMTGGSITNNKAGKAGGGVYDYGYMTVSGDVTISGNKLGDAETTGADSNVHLAYSRRPITVSDELTCKDKSIGVTLGIDDKENIAVAEPGNNVTLNAAKFFSDDKEYMVQLNDEGNLVLKTSKHEHYLCGKDPCVAVGTHGEETGMTEFAAKLTQDTNGDLLENEVKLEPKSVTLNGGTATGYVLESGKNYYLGENLNLSYSLYITSGTVGLCLNGHELKLTQTDPNSLYDVIHFAGATAATLNLTDCAPNGTPGTVTHYKDNAGKAYLGSGVYMWSNSTLNLYGGDITGNDGYSQSGGVNAYGTFNMYGGSITGNTASSSSGGVEVNQPCTFNMYAGTISGNTTNDNGGGVYVGGGGIFKMSGSSIITGNKADNGGGVYNNGTLTVSGDVQITGNTARASTAADNVFLPEGKFITVGAALGDNAKIGMIPEKHDENDVVAAPADDSVTLIDTDVGKFSIDVDDSDYDFKIILKDKNLVLAKKSDPTPPAAAHEHYLCGESTCTRIDHADTRTTFEKPINGIADLTDDASNSKKLTEGSYYLTGDLELGNYILDIYGSVTLCLNGYSITSTRTDSAAIRVSPDSRTGYSNATLMLSDCKRGGTEYGKITSNNKGAYGVYVSEGGSFYMFGGEITGNTAQNGGGVCVKAGGVEPSYRAHFTMYGGRIAGNTAAKTGGGVYVGENCTFTMSGGEITGNTAAQSGGGVYVAAGGGVGYDAAEFTVFGSAKVTGNTVGGKANNVYLPSGVTMAIDDNYSLKFAAKIGVTTETAPKKDIPVTIVENAYNDTDANQIISDNDNYQTKQNGTNNTLELVLSDRTDAGLTFISAPTAKTYGDKEFTVTASVKNPGTGGVWKPWSSSNPNVLKIVKEDGGTVTVEVVGAGTATLTATYDSPTTYGTATTAEITVSPATVTVTAKNQSIYVDGTVPDLSSPKAGTHYTVTGLVGNDALAGTVILSYQKDGKTVTPDASKAGTYTIAVSGVSEPQNGNYNPIVLKDGTLTVSNRSTGGGGGGGASVPTYPVSAPGTSGGTTAGAATGGSVSASTKNAAAGSTVSITVSPDAGYRLGKLTVVDKNGKEIPVTEKDGKYTFTMPASQVEVKPVFEKITAETAFPDVPSSAYYAEPVKWAAENGITSGTKNGGFAPGDTCTRAQIVTFLWRAAGSPEPKTAQTGMTDVSPEAYYAKAVAWAIENGITVGKTDTTFDPNGTCTRANGVTFLYRAAKAAAAGGDTGFRDVAADAYYAAAVRWALENGITNGLGSGLFGPNGGCTRAQIVTFLYRLYVKA